MKWNWQLPDWPEFTYNPASVSQKEKQFLLGSGGAFAFLKTVNKKERDQFIVEILSLEGLESSKIEGEFLERDSLQSSIKKYFGMNTSTKQGTYKEEGMAALLCNVYETFDTPLSHEMLYEWHSMLFKRDSHIDDIGKYRTHPEAMQIVSGRLDTHKVFFEAPPSDQVPEEMTNFIDWFNSTASSMSILGRAAVAHVYFESIHPFEDGNGRIGRILVEKALSQGTGQPTLIAISKQLENHKKDYYSMLGRCNRTVKITDWVEFFSETILEAQNESMKILRFLIQKSQILTELTGKINSRQEKVLLKMFAQGPEGFAGGLSAENYIAITKTSRATATRDLADLVQHDVLVKTGELRHTRYWLNLQRKYF